MSTEADSKLTQPFHNRRSASAANARKVQKIDAGIFAELLPHSTKSLTPGRSSSLPHTTPISPDDLDTKESSLPWSSPDHNLHPPVPQIQKETLTMKAYRTESPYYFSSRQLLPAGSLVFFSTKIRRYVHPTDGILFDPHPRLQSLSDAESLVLEEQWREALDSY